MFRRNFPLPHCPSSFPCGTYSEPDRCLSTAFDKKHLILPTLIRMQYRLFRRSQFLQRTFQHLADQIESRAGLNTVTDDFPLNKSIIGERYIFSPRGSPTISNSSFNGWHSLNPATSCVLSATLLSHELRHRAFLGQPFPL